MKTETLFRRKWWLVVALVALTGAVCAWPNRQGGTQPVAEPNPHAPTTGNAEERAKLVSLPPGKLAAAHVRTAVVQRTRLPLIHIVPGRLQYNDTHHVEVKAPAEGVLSRVRVKPGDRVQAGDILAWLNCHQVGTARADVLRKQAERDLSARLFEWKRRLCENVLDVIVAVTRREKFDLLREQYTERPLGNYREKLFSAYAQLMLAEPIAASVQKLGRSGVLAGKMVLQKTRELRSAEAALQAVCEQTAFDVRRERDQADLEVRDAERRLQIARQHLASLLLSPSIMDLEDPQKTPAELSGDADSSESDLSLLSRVAIRAAFAGTIERRFYAASERVRQSDALFVLADTSTLWIKAEIRENDWKAIGLSAGQELTVTTPALPGSELKAHVYYVGREVSPETNAIPLVATIDNADGLLRPGLFVRVAFQLGEEPNVLTVPESAVVQHERQSYVFVQEAENRFRRVDVSVGRSSSGRVELVDGLQEGQRFVTQGAFLLKSELLLKGGK